MLKKLKEEWKFIAGYGDKYKISNYGKILSKKANGEYKEMIYNKYGTPYWCVRLAGCTAHSRVHKLVAETFIPNLKNLPCINHKDGNKLNNRVDNLEWCTYKENSIHARDVLNTTNSKITMKQAMEIRLRTLNDEFKSIDEIAKLYNVDNRIIANILANRTYATEHTFRIDKLSKK